MRRIFICFLICIGSVSCVSDDHSMTEQKVMTTNEIINPDIEIVSPKDGSKIHSKFEVKVKAVGFELMPKGEVKDGEGHFHIMVDQPCVTAGVVIPEDQGHVHVGDGSDSKELELLPGHHKLCVQIGDGFHVATNIKKTITVYVEH